MAETKKYYWLKLRENFFKSKEIKKLRSIAGGNTYTIIYLELQLLSLENDGKLMFEGIDETFAKELSLVINEKPEDIEVTIGFLQRWGLLIENGIDEFSLTETIENIGSETPGASRVRRFRDRQKTLQGNTSVTIGNVEIEKELYKEEKDIEIDKELKKIPWQDILITWNDLPSPIKHLRSITDKRKDKIKARINSLKLKQEEIIEAISNIKKSSFLRGKNGQNWIVDFEWMFKDDTSFSKILEGKYNDKGSVPSGQPNANESNRKNEAETEGDKLAKRAIEKYGGTLGDTECEF